MAADDEFKVSPSLFSTFNDNNLFDKNNIREDFKNFDLDIIDGFAFLSFENFDHLNNECKKCSMETNVNNEQKQIKKKRKYKKRVTNCIMAEINGHEKIEIVVENEIVSSTKDDNKSSQSTSTQIEMASTLKRENNRCIDVGTSTSFPQLVSAPLINKCGVETSTPPNVNGDKCTAVKHKLIETDNDDADVRPPSTKALKLVAEIETKVPSIPSRVMSPITANQHGSLTNGVPLSVINRSTRVDSSTTTTRQTSPLLVPKKEIAIGRPFSSVDYNGEPSVSPAATTKTPLTMVNGSSRTTPSSSNSNFDRKTSSSSTISVGFTALPTTSAACLTTSSSSSAPTYFHTEMHNHQHTHMHHYTAPIMPPFQVDAPVNGSTSACVFGLPTYAPSLPALPVGPPSTLRAAVPDINAYSLPNFQLQTQQQPRSQKKGRWCGMHVQIAWDIHNRTKSKRDKQIEQSVPSSRAQVTRSEQSRCPTTSSAMSNNSNQSISTGSKSKSNATSFANHKTVEPHSNFTGFTQDNRIESRTSSSNSTSLPEATTGRSRLEREKQTSTGRAESRASGGSSVRNTPLPLGSSSASLYDNQRSTQSAIVNSGFVDVKNVAFQAAQQTSIASTSSQDGLLYRQKEFHDRVQANSVAAALASRQGCMPMLPFPFVQDGGGAMMNNYAAIQSQLNALQSTSAQDMYRLRLTLPTAANLDAIRGQIDAAGGARTAMLPLSDGIMNGQQQQMIIDQQERNQHQLLLQRLQQSPSSSTRNGTAVNPLTAYNGSERAMNRSSAIAPNGYMVPGCYPNGIAVDALTFESPGALALYSTLLRERMEFEQRSRIFGLPQALTAASTPNYEMLERLGMFSAGVPTSAADQLAAARNFAQINGQPTPQFPLNAAALGLGVYPAQHGNNKLNNGPFSTTLQQMARRGGDLLLNQLPTTTQNFQNRYI